MNSKTLLFSSLISIVAVIAVTACSGKPEGRLAPSAEHGRYIVERVGMCIDCHSPRDEKGQFIADRWLQGGPLPFAALVPMPWNGVSPRIANLPTLTDEQAVHFLTTGDLPGGRKPLPPMPPFRFSPEDAADVVAYLRAPIQPTELSH